MSKKKKTTKKSTKKESNHKKPSPLKPVKELCDENLTTRMRLFKCLDRYKQPQTAKEIKERCGLPEKSGLLARVLGEEMEMGRILRVPEETANGKVLTYALTVQGKKALKEDDVDWRKANKSLRKGWPKARWEAEKTRKKSTKKSKSKS